MNTNQTTAGLVIRPASVDDIHFIQQIVNNTWYFTYTPIIGSEQVDYMLEKFYSSLSLKEQMKNKHYFFLALKEADPVGFASYSALNKNICKLQKLYVLPQTQKTGVGKALLHKVETAAKSLGATTLQLNVNRKNVAKFFYEREGYSVITEEDIDIGNGFFMNDYIMEKDLELVD